MKKDSKPFRNNMLFYSHDQSKHDINLYVNSNSPDKHYTVEHDHTHFEFSFVANGSLFNTCNGKTVKLEKNDIMLLRPECVHKLSLNKNLNYLLFNIEIKTSFIQSVANQLGKNSIDEILRKPINYIKCTDNDILSLTTLAQLSQQHKIDNSQSQFYLRLLVVNILTLFVTQDSLNDQAPSAHYSEIVNKILSELSNPENFTLNSSEICQKYGYSHEYVIRQFKKYKLDPPNKIFIRNKMNFAALYLKTSKMKILDIAELCGIYTINHFNSSFKSQFGVSPSNYRKHYTTLD